MSLTIEQFLPVQEGGKGIPNTVIIKLPSGAGGSVVRGVLASEASVTFQNRFGSLVPDVSGLADIAQIMNATSIPSWVGASAQVWKGTDPIRLGVSFYLINYSPKLNYKAQLEALSTMCTMSSATGWSGDTSNWTIKVHGGYKPGILKNNSQQFGIKSGNDGNDIRYIKNEHALKTEIGNQLLTGSTEGTISIKIGNSVTIKHLLITRLGVTPSVVEVSDGKPLYYKVDADFQTCRAALSTDVSGMFS